MPKPSDPEKHSYMFSDDMKFLQKAIVLHPTQEKTFLILKRSPHDRTRAGDWDFPGGNVLFGELHSESLLREIKEETGLDVSEPMPTWVNSHYDEETKIYYLFISYRAKALSENVTLSEEHTEFQWISLDDFLALNTAGFLLEAAKKTFL